LGWYGSLRKNPIPILANMFIRQYPPKQPKLVQTHVGQFFEFSKNHQFWFRFFEEHSKSENCWFQLFQKLLKFDSFHEIFCKEPANFFLASSLTFSPKKLRMVVIYQICFFEFLENWWVSECVPDLIIDGYLSFILRTTQHWSKLSRVIFEIMFS